jgi:signal transduction histidine kinase
LPEATPLFADTIRTADGIAVGITAMIPDADGDLIVSTSGRGALFVGDGVVPRSAFAIGSPSVVNSIDRDENYVVWLGTDAHRGSSGVFAAAPDRDPVRIVAPTSKVLSLETNDSGTWAGTERFGLFHFVGTKLKKNYTFENTSGGLRSDTIYALFTDREGVLWIGTNRGVSRFDRLGPFQQTVSDIPNSNFIRSLFRTVDGTIYAGSNRGLFVKNDEKWTQLTAYGNQPVYSITEDRSKKLIVGTEPTDRRSFVADDATWIAGGHGVFRERGGQSEKIIDVADVRDVFVDGDQVWAATTTRGLIHARPHERFGWLVSSVSFEQGLPSEKAFAILQVDEGLLIATNRGVVTYRPATIAPKLIVSRVISQREHDLAELAKPIALDYPQNAILVEVAGQSSRTFPEEFQYSFLLKDPEGDVIDSHLTNDPQYAPADLKPGQYSIEAVAFDRDLNESEPLVIRFAVARSPFPWTATALGALLLLALVGLMWAIIEHRRMRDRNRELAAARFDLANEAERERRRIARDLHDQALADLRNLMILSDRPEVESKEFRGEIEAVSSEIRRICEDLSPSVLDNVGLIAALQFALGRAMENHRFSAADDLDERVGFPPSVQIQIYRIAQEVLTNIRSHSNADLVEMSVDVATDGSLTLSIDDNGAPFEPDASTANGRGIANIRARASLINATVRWKRRENRNRFSLTVPKPDHA